MLHHLTRLEFTALKSCFGPRAHLPDHRMMMIRSMPEIFLSVNFADVAKTACLKAANLQRGGDSVAKGSLELASGKVIYIYICMHVYIYT